MWFDGFNAYIGGRSRRVHGNKLRGVVVDNNDPEKRGRMKVRYRDIHDDIPDSDLPWSAPQDGYDSGSKDVGKVNLPPNGSVVFGNHQDNSLYHPQWTAGPSTDDKKPSELTGDDYPHTRGHQDDKGNFHYHKTKDDENTMGFEHQKGTKYEIDKDGKYIINGANEVNISGAKSIKLIGKDPVNIESESAVNIRAPKVNINDKAPGKAETTKEREKPNIPKGTGMTEY